MQICLTISAAPILDPRLTPGAVRLLLLLRSLAGHARMLQTLTSALARQLDRCPNTIRSYRDQLVEAGYIWWTTDRRTGITRILIRTAVEPPSRQAWLAGEGGAQFAAPIKSRKIIPPYQHLADAARRAWQREKAEAAKPRPPVLLFQPPVRTVAEQIAFCLAQAQRGGTVSGR